MVFKLILLISCGYIYFSKKKKIFTLNFIVITISTRYTYVYVRLTLQRYPIHGPRVVVIRTQMYRYKIEYTELTYVTDIYE